MLVYESHLLYSQGEFLILRYQNYSLDAWMRTTQVTLRITGLRMILKSSNYSLYVVICIASVGRYLHVYY